MQHHLIFPVQDFPVEKHGGLVAGLVIYAPLVAKTISPTSVDKKRSRHIPASHKSIR